MKHLVFLLILICIPATAQENSHYSEELNITPWIDGTLLVPDSTNVQPLAILIGGSGPTDRDGNQPMLENNSLRFLAEGLYKHNIATFRYDKRIVKQIRMGAMQEDRVRFEDFIEDAIAVLDYFKEDNRFSKIYVIGHSQGSLVGMIAAQNGADGFISIAGAGQQIDDVIVDQLAVQAPGLTDNARTSFDDLRVNGVVHNYNPALASIFRKEIQAFLLEWMLIDPQVEVAKLDMPVLIVNGEEDLQVSVSEAEILKAANPDARYEIIPGMNHILKEVEGDPLENSKTYNRPDLPVMPLLVEILVDFIED